MDVQILHTDNSTGRHYTMKDRLNNWTSRRQCSFLELSGWYNYSVRQRLLGHYRHYQHFKKAHAKHKEDLSPARDYILNYSTTHGVKYFIAGVMSILYSIFARKTYYAVATNAALNKRLIHKAPHVLEEFLINADTDFEPALTAAIDRINASDFLKSNHPTPLSPAPEGAQGKEKGVFSKHQVLILIDLMAIPGKVKFVAKKSYRLDGIAEFLHALTGKGRESWLKELSDHKNTDLYQTHTPAQTDNLINTIRNLVGICQKAGLTDIAAKAEKKITDLEQRRARQQRLPPGS